MSFKLVVVNTPNTEFHPDKRFPTMDLLVAWVDTQGYDWTSLIVTVQPY